LASQLAATRAELANLQERYDALRADRDRLAQTLEEKMKTWKRFKRHFIVMKGGVPSKAKRDKDMRMKRIESSTPASQQQSVVKMLETPITPMSLSLPSFVWLGGNCNHRPEPRPARAGVRLSPAKSVGLGRSPLSQNRHILNTPRCAFKPSWSHPVHYLTQCSNKIRVSSEGSPSTRHLKRTRDENEDTVVDEMSQTQEDSQGWILHIMRVIL